MRSKMPKTLKDSVNCIKKYINTANSVEIDRYFSSTFFFSYYIDKLF